MLFIFLIFRITNNFISIEEKSGDYFEEAQLRRKSKWVRFTDLKPDTTYVITVKSMRGEDVSVGISQEVTTLPGMHLFKSNVNSVCIRSFLICVLVADLVTRVIPEICWYFFKFFFILRHKICIGLIWEKTIKFMIKVHVT